jgi:hypothetical protein
MRSHRRRTYLLRGIRMRRLRRPTGASRRARCCPLSRQRASWGLYILYLTLETTFSDPSGRRPILIDFATIPVGWPPHRKTRLRWHQRMKTYTDQTRDQYMPGAPSRKARQSRSTATGSSPTGATACGSRRVWSMAFFRPCRIQRSNGSTKPLLGRSNSAGSSPRRPIRRSTVFRPSGE